VVVHRYLNIGENSYEKRVEFGGAYIAQESATYFIKGFNLNISQKVTMW